jgi:diguanylate cyclase (GGDEF)-like protein
MAAATAVGLFGLDPSGPGLVHPKAASKERLSPARLAFLCVAVAFIPVAVGARVLLAGGAAVGLLLMVPGVIAVLVIARIGVLSEQHSRAEASLQYQATHDPLTQLPNRRQFGERLREELGRGARCALLFCDLDGFKAINDRLGHDAGDELLVEVAHRLQSCVGPRDVVCRIGGDEFVVLLIEPTPGQEADVQSRVGQAMLRPIARADDVRIAISVGVAWADGERDPERLIRSADNAMYEVKAARGSGRSRSHGDTSQ